MVKLVYFMGPGLDSLIFASYWLSMVVICFIMIKIESKHHNLPKFKVINKLLSI
jgi:hypothetical protein